MSSYSLKYLAETVHSNTRNKDYYFIRICLYKDDVLIVKGSPIVWLTKEQYDEYTSQK